MSDNWRKIAPNVYRVGDTVFFRAQINGRRKMERAPMQGALALNDRGRPTEALKKAAVEWLYRQVNSDYLDKNTKPVAPSFDELLDAYEVAAVSERARTGGRPSESTVAHAILYFGYILDACGLDRAQHADALTNPMIADAISSWIRKGAKPVSAWTYAAAAKSITARWVRTYYTDKRWAVPEWTVPPRGPQNKPPRYKWPRPETFEQVKRCYAEIADADDPRWWSIATLMLNCGMRNSDVAAATPDWFRQVDDGSYILDYTPHKTSLSSGRRVLVPVLRETRDELLRRRDAYLARRDYAGDELVPHADNAIRTFNAYLRQHVDEWRDKEKAAYELRKMCGAIVYKKLGAEAACARLGDDLKTVSYFYSDPAVAHGRAMSVNDLLS